MKFQKKKKLNSTYREKSEKDKNVYINLNLKRKGKSNKMRKFTLIKFKTHKLKT